MVTSVLFLFSLGLLASIILAIASKVLYVEEDPRIEAVSEALPGANCGGCGFAGCDGYAAAVVQDPNCAPNLCCAGGPEISAQVAELTGKAMGDSEPQVAYRRCLKNEGDVKLNYEYQGVPSCKAAKMLNNGPDACGYSCLGLGDCVRACPFDAIFIASNGLPSVDADKCTACGNCVRACPNDILELIPQRARVMIACSSLDKGKAVMDVCKVGCISCMKCVKECPAKAIKLEGGRIQIDHALCLEYGPDCNENCTDKCPRNIIRCLPIGMGQMHQAA